MEFTLIKLPYDFDGLEPVIDAKTVEIHYSKHHQNYLNNLNLALSKHPEIEGDLEWLLKHIESLPQDIATSVKNNGGGVFNHNLYWNILGKAKKHPSGKLLMTIEKEFGSFEKFKQEFTTAGTKHFGSGWVFLVCLPNNTLKIITTANQDTPLIYGKPILAFDLWEHSYYLLYQNRKSEYLENIWQIVNWEAVENLFE